MSQGIIGLPILSCHYRFSRRTLFSGQLLFVPAGPLVPFMFHSGWVYCSRPQDWHFIIRCVGKNHSRSMFRDNAPHEFRLLNGRSLTPEWWATAYARIKQMLWSERKINAGSGTIPSAIKVVVVLPQII